MEMSSFSLTAGLVVVIIAFFIRDPVVSNLTVLIALLLIIIGFVWEIFNMRVEIHKELKKGRKK